MPFQIVPSAWVYPSSNFIILVFPFFSHSCPSLFIASNIARTWLLCKKILRENSSLHKPFAGCLERLMHQKYSAPSGSLNFPGRTPGRLTLYFRSPSGIPVFLTKDRYFRGLPRKYLQDLGLDIFGEKRKELQTWEKKRLEVMKNLRTGCFGRMPACKGMKRLVILNIGRT